MSGVETAGRKVRFGVFELDPKTGELRKDGSRIRLQEQPFRVLVSLIERPGELVTREELRKKLWPDDTFVDFDQGLGTAIRKLREALSDSADNPRFIETLPRRGFRFIAPVNGFAAAAVAGPGVPSQTLEPSARQRSFPRRAVLVAGVLLGIGLLAFLLRPSLPSPSVSRITRLTNDGRPKYWFIVADSARLYFTERIGGRYTPVAVSTRGGEAVPIPAPVPEAVVLDISRDGSELLMGQVGGEGEPIWAVPISGAPARRVGDLETGEARWSPDGQKILYLKGGLDPHLYVEKSDGTDSRALVKVPGLPYDILWSPDGTRITVSVYDGKSNMVWEVSSDGTNLHPVLPDWNFPNASCSGSWTFDGKYLLFESNRGGPDNIWAIREKTDLFHKASRQPTQLITGPFDVSVPVPSEDGKRIFVIGGKTNAPARLHRYDSKSKAWKPFLQGISAEHVDFSRDRQWVAYVSFPDAILFRSKIDGSQKLQLTSPPVQAAMPRISPDGKTIAYMARTPGKPWRIRLTPFAGGGSQPLTSADFEQVEPNWSPDGRLLAFCRNQSAGSSHTIVLFDTGTRRISSLPPLAELYYPRWSPDGRYIAATDGSQKVVRFDLKTRKWEVLVKDPAHLLYAPIWSSDGRSIYFINYAANRQGYYRFRIRDRQLEKIVGTDGDYLQAVGGITGGWYGLTPDGSLLTLFGTGTNEIYALEWNAP